MRVVPHVSSDGFVVRLFIRESFLADVILGWKVIILICIPRVLLQPIRLHAYQRSVLGFVASTFLEIDVVIIRVLGTRNAFAAAKMGLKLNPVQEFNRASKRAGIESHCK
jgi:hypothetical protein